MESRGEIEEGIKTKEQEENKGLEEGNGGGERERKGGRGSLMRPLGFDGRKLGAPTPHRPLDYQSFISASAPESAGAESSGGPIPLQLPHHKINQHLSAAAITALTYIIPLCSTVSLLNSK